MPPGNIYARSEGTQGRFEIVMTDPGDVAPTREVLQAEGIQVGEGIMGDFAVFLGPEQFEILGRHVIGRVFLDGEKL